MSHVTRLENNLPVSIFPIVEGDLTEPTIAGGFSFSQIKTAQTFTQN